MVYEKELKNHRILVRNIDNDDIVADAEIKEFDWKTNTVRLSAGTLKDKNCLRVTALIFGSEGIYEYSGTVRKKGASGTVEIALYNGKEKVTRNYKRYHLNTKGTIKSVVTEDGKQKTTTPFKVEVVNMSGSGVLIKADKGSLKVKDKIVLNPLLDETELTLECAVVRERDLGKHDAEYGCQIEAAYKK